MTLRQNLKTRLKMLITPLAQYVSDAETLSDAKELLVGHLTESANRARTKSQANKLKLLSMKVERMTSKAEVEKLAWNMYLKYHSNPYDV